MRLTIIPIDKKINIDGENLSPIQQDLSWIPENIHAVQWYDTHGEIEFNDGSLNQIIDELGIYEQAIVTFHEEKQRLENERIVAEIAFEESRDYSEELRYIRNQYLFDSDWTQFSDSPLLDDKKLEWKSYRQKLRELPEIITDPKPLVLDLNHTDWPIRPT